jgi:hypothetical protein
MGDIGLDGDADDRPGDLAVGAMSMDNDDLDNLRPMPETESHAQGSRVKEDKNFHALWNWFHFIRLHGWEPSDAEAKDDSLLFV